MKFRSPESKPFPVCLCGWVWRFLLYPPGDNRVYTLRRRRVSHKGMAVLHSQSLSCLGLRLGQLLWHCLCLEYLSSLQWLGPEKGAQASLKLSSHSVSEEQSSLAPSWGQSDWQKGGCGTKESNWEGTTSAVDRARAAETTEEALPSWPSQRHHCRSGLLCLHLKTLKSICCWCFDHYRNLPGCLAFCRH